MKTAKFDLVTAIFMLLVGGAFAFALCSLLLPKLQDESFRRLETTVESTIGVPDEEIFNVKAINPTVEVCVGCTNEEVIEETPVEEE